MDFKAELEELKDRRPSRASFEQMAKITAAMLNQSATTKAFELFRDKKFRNLAHFNSLDQTEQDRIFNELILAFHTLIVLTLEAPDLRVKNDFKEYLQLLKEETPKAYLAQLQELGVENEHLKLWKKLFKMRYEEYSSDRLKAREAAMIVESRDKELTGKDLEDITLFLPVPSVAIGCHYHICRQKVKGRDELFKLTIKWLGRFYIEVRVRMEGGDTTLLKRMKMKVKYFLNDLKDSK